MLVIIIALIFLMAEPSIAEVILPSSIHGKYVIKTSEDIYILREDLTVEPDGILIIEPNVNIKISENKSIHVYGEIKALASSEQIITIDKEFENKPWNSFIFFPGSKCVFQNVVIYDGAIYADSAELNFFNTIICNYSKEIVLPYIYVKSSKFYIDSCYLDNKIGGDFIVIEKSNNITVKNSKFYNSDDLLEFSDVKDGIIENNFFFNSQDDGIDLNGCDNIIIRNNVIILGQDKGISVGNSFEKSSKNIKVEKNVIQEFAAGISVKGGSEVLIDNCTIYNNSIALEAWQKEAETGGGHLSVRNTIIANCKEIKSIDKYSSVNFEYCLSDTEELEGEYNIIGDPKFYKIDNFLPISYDSPAIDSGDPNYPNDPDGTRADIGANFFDQRLPKIVINEINYNSAFNFDSGDWIEFVNIGDENEFLENSFITLNDEIIFVFDSVTLAKDEKFTIVNDTSKYHDYFSSCNDLGQNIQFFKDLPRQGSLKFYDSTSRLTDEVNYSNVFPWDTNADEKGHSLELIDPMIDNSLAENWKASLKLGTPCQDNSIYKDTTSIFDDKINNYQMIVYPNPGGNIFNLRIKNVVGEQVDIKMFDMIGRKINFLSNIFYVDNDVLIKVILPKNLNYGNYIIALTLNNFHKFVIYNYSDNAL